MFLKTRLDLNLFKNIFSKEQQVEKTFVKWYSMKMIKWPKKLLHVTSVVLVFSSKESFGIYYMIPLVHINVQNGHIDQDSNTER